MRLLKQQIDARTQTGAATLLPEEPEDMWHAYNLIQPHDLIRARAMRRLTKESDSGSVSSTRVAMDLTISVRSTDFDINAGQLHVAGQVAVENEWVKLGSFHTLDLELNRKFTIEKNEGWDSVALTLLKEAIDTTRRAELWAVVMDEGLANICLITEHQTILRARIEEQIPKKRRQGTTQADKALQKFLSTTLATLLRHMDLANAPTAQQTDKTIPLLLASPGFTASRFLEFMKAEATRTNNKPLITLIPSVIIAHSSSAHIHHLDEVLRSQALKSKLSDTKYARETALLDRLFEYIRKDDGRAWYGHKEVEKAVDQGAVGRGGGVLLISNALFRANDVAQRKRWVGLVDRVREVEGGEVRVLSSLHESGKRLEGLGNVAAILTFPILDLDVEEDEGTVDGAGGHVTEERDMII